MKQVKNFLPNLGRDNQAAYREFYLPNDRKAARIVTVLIAIAIAVFIISDFLFLNFSLAFFGLLALRIGLVAVSLLIARLMIPAIDFQYYDRACLSLMLSISLGILFINATRPTNFLPQVVIVDAGVLLIYLIVTTKFLYQAICASVFSVGQGLILFSILPEVGGGVVTSAFSILLSNVIGAFISWQIHSYRWELYENITKYKETERLATVGQTAGMVGHDIRNPLQAMVSDIYLAKSELENLPENKAKQGIVESLDSIDKNVDYVNKIVQDLQDYARPLSPSKKKIEINRLFDGVLLTKAIPPTIKVTRSVAGDAKEIDADPDLLKRALANLVNNAVQAMTNGGELELRAYREQNCVVITVQDSGMGIPEEIKPRLFTPLFTTKSKGQGFGLAVVKRMAEASGGTVSFESELGKGTKFIIKLPITN